MALRTHAPLETKGSALGAVWFSPQSPAAKGGTAANARLRSLWSLRAVAWRGQGPAGPAPAVAVSRRESIRLRAKSRAVN